ncbi:MAG: hypothetical protein ACKVQT_35790 [Burkholderiales bacterium]
MVNTTAWFRFSGVVMTTFALGILRAVTAMGLVGGLAACGGGGGGGGDGGGGAAAGAAPGTPNAPDLQSEINQRFPYVANQPIDVTFSCRRVNSKLAYYFKFDLNWRFTVFFETDNYQQYSFVGGYSHANGAMRMVADPNNILALDETTTRIASRLGILAEFETPAMRCDAIGHGYNDPVTESYKSYDCPQISPTGLTIEDNAIEFTYSAAPFNGYFYGSTFRQREVGIVPLITRGYGIYRRVGNTFYADFWNNFADVNLLKGTFLNGDSQLSVEQLKPEVGPCNKR